MTSPPCSTPHRPRLVPIVITVLTLLLLGWGGQAAYAGDDPVPHGTWPLQPTHVVVAGFDPPGSTYGAGHRGVDLLGSPGEAVHTALPGRVTYAGRLAGRGVVVVDHGDTRTTYEPVTATVRVGQVVVGGQVIGSLELSGSHCFPRACLHWGWLRATVYLDPLLLVGGGPVRLLPLDGAPVAAAGPLPVARAAAAREPATTLPVPVPVPVPPGWQSVLMGTIHDTLVPAWSHWLAG